MSDENEKSEKGTTMLRPLYILMLLLAILGLPGTLYCAPSPEVTDPAVAQQDPDFAIQGEYLGNGKLGRGEPGKIGAQVIALGDGKFDVQLLRGGLPGKGWDQGDKIALEGQRQDQTAELKGERLSGKIAGDTLTLTNAKGKTVAELKRIARQSETIDLAPPAGAVVLYGGPEKNQFDADHGDIKEHISPDGNLIAGVTSQPTLDKPYTLHLEFRLSWMPKARGQARSNSGVYLHDAYEVQVLDSFGLSGADNECGGIYKVKAPDVNMCLPPMVWQTYDMEFTPPKYDADGNKTANARLKAWHNGVVIHKDLELPGGTPGRKGEGPGPRGLHLQGHGNHVQYRNVWVLPEGAQP
jgi:hypothetical protein